MSMTASVAEEILNETKSSCLLHALHFMETNIPSVIQPLIEHFTHFRVSLALI
jgi:hypothetical protein